MHCCEESLQRPLLALWDVRRSMHAMVASPRHHAGSKTTVQAYILSGHQKLKRTVPDLLPLPAL